MYSVPFLSCIRFTLQLLISEYIFMVGWPRRNPFFLRFFSSMVLCFGGAALWYTLLNTAANWSDLFQISYYVGIFLLTMAAIGIQYDITPAEILFVGTSGYATEHLAHCVERLLRFFLHAQPSEINVYLDNIVFRFLIYVLVAEVIYLLIVRKNKGKGAIQEKDIRIAWMALALLLVAIALSTLGKDTAILQQETVATEVFFPIYGGAFCGVILLLEYSIIRENKALLEKNVLDQMIRMANQQQKNSKETIDIINMKCHDLKHQIRALAALGSSHERSSYLQEVQNAVALLESTYHTGCEALDYVLQEKSLICQNNQIIFSCMADGEAMAFMESADIYALMGNALDNALESVMKEPEDQRVISLKIKKTGAGGTSIHLENQCSRELVFEDGLPITDKEDKNFHGFGVRSIRYIAEKYHGVMLMKMRDEMFILDILVLKP